MGGGAAGTGQGSRLRSLANGGDLGRAFRERFGQRLHEDTPNQGHLIVIVAVYLDASSACFVDYLNRSDIAMNVLCFEVFKTEDGPFLNRA